jgi:molybdopterin-containing oxidoreductase family iron-sulfur binding subunit
MTERVKASQRWGMVIDLDRCTACQACVTACQVENNIAPPTPEVAAVGRAIRWMDILPHVEGEYPRVKLRLLPRPCMQCDNPPCIKVCPVGATTRGEDGIVAQVYARCIGCRYCTTACPYTLRYFNWYEPSWPGDLGQALNPDVSIRPKGVVEKCTFCHHRLQKARDRAAAEKREIEPGEYTPACADSCPTAAIAFGDLDDPSSQVSRMARSPRAFRLLEDLGTEPRVHYLREGEA